MDKSIGEAIGALAGKRNLLTSVARFLPSGYAPLVCHLSGLKPDVIVHHPDYKLPWLIEVLYSYSPYVKPRRHGIRHSHGVFVATPYSYCRPDDDFVIAFKD